MSRAPARRYTPAVLPLILVPALITLAVTLARLAGELRSRPVPAP